MNKEEEEGTKEKMRNQIKVLSAEKPEGVGEILERIHEINVKGMTENDSLLLKEVLKSNIRPDVEK